MTFAGAVAALVAVAAVLAGCGEASPEKSTPAPARGLSAPPAAPHGTVLEVSADPDNGLAFDKRRLRTTPGRVTLIMDNPSTLAHNIVLTGHGLLLRGQTVRQDGSSTITATLAPGRYSYFCSVPGHRKAGMNGTLLIG